MRASLLLQRALYAALSADPVLAGQGLRVFDRPPADTPPPFVTIGLDEERDWGWKGGGGRELRFQVFVWEARDGLSPLKAAMAEAERVVMAMPRRISGLRIVSLGLVSAKVRPNPKSWAQGVLEFRARSVMEA